MFHIEPASSDEWTNAFEVAFAQLPAEQRAARVEHGIHLMQAGILDPRGVLVARKDARIVGVQICEILQGSACLFWLPGADNDCADALVHAGLDWCRTRGCKLAQALARPDELTRSRPLVRAGFRAITRLGQWRRDLTGLPPFRESTWRVEHFRPGLAQPFADTLERTYEGTFDCPELNGVRTIDEIIAGHRAQGKFRSDFWWHAYSGDRPAGVLMMAEMLDGTTWELAYLGVVPEFRRRGLARYLLTRALHGLLEQPATHVVLAVDDRNTPARRMYESLGFVQFDASEVYLFVV